MKRTTPFSKAAKRNAILAGLFALPPVCILALGVNTPKTTELTSEQKVEDALASNKGTKGMSNYEACLYNNAQNERVLGKAVQKADCDSIKNWISPQERVRMADNQGLIKKCEAQIRPALKDPISYRYISHRYVVQDARGIDVKVTYTATNSFGGRIQNVESCSFTF